MIQVTEGNITVFLYFQTIGSCASDLQHVFPDQIIIIIIVKIIIIIGSLEIQILQVWISQHVNNVRMIVVHKQMLITLVSINIPSVINDSGHRRKYHSLSIFPDHCFLCF